MATTGEARKTEIKTKLSRVFAEEQARVLTEVISEAYNELVKARDFNELKDIVKELAEAQKRTELRVEELAEAQKRTEEELRELVREHKKTRTQLGGISMTVGYRLEDEAYKSLPELLRRDMGLVVEGRLKRQFVTDRMGMKIEVNIIGEAKKNGRKVMIVGEGKSQLSKKGVDEFISKKLKRLEGVYEEIFPLLITYMISEPEVEDYAREKGIAIYYSYDF